MNRVSPMGREAPLALLNQPSRVQVPLAAPNWTTGLPIGTLSHQASSKIRCMSMVPVTGVLQFMMISVPGTTQPVQGPSM